MAVNSRMVCVLIFIIDSDIEFCDVVDNSKTLTYCRFWNPQLILVYRQKMNKGSFRFSSLLRNTLLFPTLSNLR